MKGADLKQSIAEAIIGKQENRLNTETAIIYTENRQNSYEIHLQKNNKKVQNLQKIR